MAEQTSGKLLEAWAPPPGAGNPVGAVATTFTFDAGFFEEELLARYLAMETSVEDGRAWLVEREERLGDALAVVLVDRRHAARQASLAWDLLAVPLPGETCFHPKITVLAWEGWVRVIVGSANLTQAAYRQNFELYSLLDFHPEGVLPVTLLEELLNFLERCVARIPEPRGAGAVDDGPVTRAAGLIASIRRLAGRLGLPQTWGRGVPQVAAVFLEPGRGQGVLPQMGELWGTGPRPDYVQIVSPFWADERSDGVDPVVAATHAEMAKRGQRAIDIRVPGIEASEGVWIVRLPSVVASMDGHPPQLGIAISPIPAIQDEERRPLHAKMIIWDRGGGREFSDPLLLLGSSNASVRGLGIGAAARNVEANLCYLPDASGLTRRLAASLPPDCAEPEELRYELDPAGCPDDEGGPPPVPAFFRYAVLREEETQWVVEVGLGDADEPEAWELRVPGWTTTIVHDEYRSQGRPKAVRIAQARQGEAAPPPPGEVAVKWRRAGPEHKGSLPLNAASTAERSRAELWRDIDLETLLGVLAEGGSLYRHFKRKQAREGAGGGTTLPRELDPHRRVDTSGFLMPRMRRISRALEGLRARLEAPVVSEAQLAWRFRGPLSPGNLAERLLASVADPAERAFLLAEILLSVSRASRSVKAEGVAPDVVKESFRATVSRLQALAPLLAGSPPLDAYLEAVAREVAS